MYLFISKLFTFLEKSQVVLTRLCIRFYTPFKAIQMASAGLIMISFGALLPVLIFLEYSSVMKVFIVFFASLITYFITDYCCSIARKNNKKK